MSNPFTPSPDDGAVQMLRMVFGPVIDSIVANPNIAQVGSSVSSTANMLTAAFQYFNSGVLFFTSILMSYVVIFGVANSANDGEVLGNKWSTFYTPLRTFGASAMLIPTASGYSGIQIFLLMITTWSIGFASNMWNAVLENAYTNDLAPMVASSVIDDKKFEELAMNVVRMRVCAHAATKAYQALTGGTSTELQFTAAPPTTETSMGGMQTITSKLSYSVPGWPGSSAICGSINMSDSFNPLASDSKTTGQAITNLHNAIVKIRYSYTLGLFGAPGGTVGGPSLDSIVQKIITTAETDGATIDAVNDVAAPLQAIRQQMTAAMIAEVTSTLSQSNQDIIKKLGANGWIYAGSLYKEISTIKESVRSATKSSYYYSPGPQDISYKLAGEYLKVFTNTTANYDLILQMVTQKVLASPSTTTGSTSSTSSSTDKMQTNFTVADFAGGGDGVTAGINRFFNAIPIHIVSGIVTQLSDTEGDPIWVVKGIGDNIRNVIEAVIEARIIAASSLAALAEGSKTASNEAVLGTNLAAGGGILVGAVTFIITSMALTWEEMRIGLYTILYAGYYMSIWVPSIPFFIYTIGVAGWAVFVVEMLAAGSLWMAAHTAPAREDSFIGSQTQGYMLVMSGFFRPALMVLGLIASIALTRPLVQFLNEAFKLMFMSMTADSFTGITGIAGYLLLYCTMLFALLSLVFALPQTLPDRVLRWVGAGIGDMGEQGTMSKIEGASSAHARQAQSAGHAREDAARRVEDDKTKGTAQSARDGVQREIMTALRGMSGSDVEGQGGQGGPPPDDVKDTPIVGV